MADLEDLLAQYTRSTLPSPNATPALPDLEGAFMRQRVAAAQSPKDRWLEDHDRNMRAFMERIYGLVPGLNAGRAAYNAWADPEHPVTQSERSIPAALGYGLLGTAEIAAPAIAGQLLKRMVIPFTPRTVQGRQDLAGEDVIHAEFDPKGPLHSAVASAVMSQPATAGMFGLAPPRSSVSGYLKEINPQTITDYYPFVPGAVRPAPRRDKVSDMAAPERPLTGFRVHTEPVDTYHGTGVGFTKFDKSRSRDFGIHSGTPKAAEDRTASAWEDTGRIMPLKLGPQDRPFTSLEVKDLGVWRPLPLARELERQGVRFTDKEFEAILGKGGYAPRKEDAYPVIEDVLNRHGIDVLRYRNVAEDPGSTSWITWNPETVYSRTSGAQLYGVPIGAGALGLLSRYDKPTEPE